MHDGPKTMWMVILTYQNPRQESLRPRRNEGDSIKHYAIGLKVTKPMVCLRGLYMTEVNAMASHVGPMPARLLDVDLHYQSGWPFRGGARLRQFGALPSDVGAYPSHTLLLAG